MMTTTTAAAATTTATMLPARTNATPPSYNRIQSLRKTIDTLCSSQWKERLNLDGYYYSFSTNNTNANSLSLIDIGINTQTCSDSQFYSELLRAKAAGVDHVILTGTDYKRNQAGMIRVQEYTALMRQDESGTSTSTMGTLHRLLPKLYFTAGIHPHDAARATSQTWNQIELFCKGNIVEFIATDEDNNSGGSDSNPVAAIAVGECGLDYDRMRSPRSVQLDVFRRMVQLAAQFQRPLFVHERELDTHRGTPLGSCTDLCHILDEFCCNNKTMATSTDQVDELKNKGGSPSSFPTTIPTTTTVLHPNQVCVHCFTGGQVELEAYLSRGYWIGITGYIAMRKRGAILRQLIIDGHLPLDRILIETDAPYMRGDKDYYTPKEVSKPIEKLVEDVIINDLNSATSTTTTKKGQSEPSCSNQKTKPSRHRKKLRPYTQPADVTAVARALAELLSVNKKGTDVVTYETVCQITTRNAMEFFRIGNNN